MRRHSDSDKQGSSRRGKIPIPVSVSVRNLCPKSMEEEAQSKSNKKWFRPEHDMSLLHRAKLEIVIAPPSPPPPPFTTTSSSDDGGSNLPQPAEEKVIFSSLAENRTVNPSWNHLDECIENYLAMDGYLDSETGSYRFMRLRLWLLTDDDIDNSGSKEQRDSNHNDNSKSPLSGTREEQRRIPLLDISIHPTKLRHLASHPQQLPVNSVIFNFSDGSIRATKALLDIVGDQDGKHQDEHNKDEFGRFGDDVFRTLDQVTPVKPKKQSNASKGRGEGGATETTTHNKSGGDASTSPLLVQSFSEDSQEGGGGGGGSSTPWSKPNMMSATEKKQQKELLAVTEQKFPAGESDATSQDIDTERQHLEKLIQMEEEALNQELLSLQKDKEETQSLMEKASRIGASTAKLEEGIVNEKQLCRRSEFFLEARRIKLLLDLRNIYPITFLLGEDRYCIRDLRIPIDIHSGIVGEEELSAALGFLCHLLILISNYLSVQLRHRVFCNSSRSAIQEDGGTIYPLFLKGVERDQLDHGLVLLHRNVECILKTADIEYKPREHILINVKRLFDAVSDS